MEADLLDLEAKATGKTKEQLLDEGVKAKAGAVSDADVDAYYTQLQTQQPRACRPRKQIAERIKQFLQQQKDPERAQNLFFIRAEGQVQGRDLPPPAARRRSPPRATPPRVPPPPR